MGRAIGPSFAYLDTSLRTMPVCTTTSSIILKISCLDKASAVVSIWWIVDSENLTTCLRYFWLKCASQSTTPRQVLACPEGYSGSLDVACNKGEVSILETASSQCHKICPAGVVTLWDGMEIAHGDLEHNQKLELKCPEHYTGWKHLGHDEMPLLGYF